MGAGTVRGFVVATVCQSVEELVERYYTRVGANWLFVSVIEERVVGRECAFALLLANRHPVLAGTGEVIEVFPDADNQFQRRGMLLRIRRLGVESQLVFDRLVTRATSGRSSARLARGSDAPLLETEASQTALVDVDYDAIPIDIDDDPLMPMQR